MVSFPEYHRYDATGLADLIRRGEVKAIDVVGEAIDTIERHNPVLNAVIYKMYDRAQARTNRTLPAGPFSGVPFLLKDLGLAYLAAPLTNGASPAGRSAAGSGGTRAAGRLSSVFGSSG